MKKHRVLPLNVARCRVSLIMGHTSLCLDARCLVFAVTDLLPSTEDPGRLTFRRHTSVANLQGALTSIYVATAPLCPSPLLGTTHWVNDSGNQAVKSCWAFNVNEVCRSSLLPSALPYLIILLPGLLTSGNSFSVVQMTFPYGRGLHRPGGVDVSHLFLSFSLDLSYRKSGWSCLITVGDRFREV